MGHPRLSYQDFAATLPAAHAALVALGRAIDGTGLDTTIIELVKLRVSQINGCAFCLQLHLNISRRHGVDATKLDLVSVWPDAGVFSAREQAALAWAERLTAIASQGAPDESYAALLAHFSPAEASQLTVAIATINSWNRIAVALRFAPHAADPR